MLESPRPIGGALAVPRFKYPVNSVDYLLIPSPRTRADLFHVLDQRISRRRFEPISTEMLAEFLWHLGRTRQLSTALADHAEWERRAVPSAGGLHVVDLLTQRRCRDAIVLSHYQPRAHALELLNVEIEDVERLWQAAQEVISEEAACVIWFCADLEPLQSRYQNFESLVWRDSGVLLGVGCVIAEALGLACCPLGITGGNMLSHALGSERVFGCGAMMIGGRAA
jgi:SagB-type dehydrogenase family enzyme